MFDPRRPRAQAKGPHAHAEAVTGTHLYAYLQDQDLPANLTVTAAADGRDGADAQIAALLSAGEAGGGADADSKAARRSLLQQIKQAKEAFAEAFRVLHDDVSGSDAPAGAGDRRAGSPGGPRVALSLPPGAFSCGDEAVVSRLVVRGTGGEPVVLGVALVSVASVLGELFVFCAEVEEDSHGGNNARPLLAARVVLDDAVVASALSLRLCVAPPPPPSAAASPTGDDDDEDGEGEGAAASRVAAVMGIGEASSPSSSGTGSPACVFRVDLDDLRFAPLQPQPANGFVGLVALVYLAQELAHVSDLGLRFQHQAYLLAQPFRCPAQMHFQHLTDVHTRRYTKRVQHYFHWRTIGHARHVFHRHDARHHTLVTVATGHLVAGLQAAFHRHIHLDHLLHAGLQFVALRQFLFLQLERSIEFHTFLRQPFFDLFHLNGHIIVRNTDV